MVRGETTNPDIDRWALTPQQQAAVDLPAAGTSVTDTAESISVVRQTVSEWLHHHRGFRAALNRCREEPWSSPTHRLRALLPKAVAVLEREIDQGGAPLAAAVHVLKACALYGKPQPISSTDPGELDVGEREHAAEQLRRHLDTF